MWGEVVNYIKEINAFYDWLETNSLSDSAIVLWHSLMHINNRAGWITEFAVAVSTIQVKTGLKKDAIVRARLKLQQTGRIDFRSRTGQQSAIYTLIPFESDKNDGCVVLNDTNCITNRAQSATQTTTQTASIIKLNKTKLNNTTATRDDGYESFYKAHERVFGFSCNPFQASTLGTYIDQDGIEEPVIIRAIERAALNGTGYKFGLITKILDDYFKSNVRTLGQAIAFDNAFETNKSSHLVPGNSRKSKQQQELERLKRLAEEGRSHEQIRSS